MIFIAGNENLHREVYRIIKQACDAAKKKGVVLNTIYCSNVNDNALVWGGTWWCRINRRSIYEH